MDHIERVEAALEEMRLHPDRIIHQLYLGYHLHECSGLAEMSNDEREKLLHAVLLSCHHILCPPLAVGANGEEVYLLVQQNVDRSMEDIAQAAGAALGKLPDAAGTPRWSGYYSGISLGMDDAEEFTESFSAGDARVCQLFSELEEEA